MSKLTSLLFSWTGSTICSIVLCIAIIFIMKKDVEESLSSEWYVAGCIISCIPVINYVLMFCIIFGTIFGTITGFLINTADKFRGKVKQKQLSDIDKYNQLKKLLVSADIFKDYSHIENFIQSGDVYRKLSEKI